MKAVLMSIQPKWSELIASGKKTVEVRKTKPKLETPFKVYIYCTSSNVHECLMQNEGGVKMIYACNYKTAIPCGGHIANGKVIGEFVCDRIDNGILSKSYFVDSINIGYDQTCVSIYEVAKYLDAYGACGMYEFYGWHISDLVIYDKPKELREFKQCHKCEYYANCYEHEYSCDGVYNLVRPPQSWCYVEELKGE